MNTSPLVNSIVHQYFPRYLCCCCLRDEKQFFILSPKPFFSMSWCLLRCFMPVKTFSWTKCHRCDSCANTSDLVISLSSNMPKRLRWLPLPFCSWLLPFVPIQWLVQIYSKWRKDLLSSPPITSLSIEKTLKIDTEYLAILPLYTKSYHSSAAQYIYALCTVTTFSPGARFGRNLVIFVYVFIGVWINLWGANTSVRKASRIHTSSRKCDEL